jgi:hypothetical protein
MLFSTRVSELQIMYTRYPRMSSKVVLDLKAACASLKLVSSASFLPPGGGFGIAVDSIGDEENTLEVAI